MSQVNDTFIYNGRPQNGATAKLWKKAAFYTSADSGDTVQDNPLTAISVTLNVANGALFAIGNVIKIDDEHCLVENIVVNALTILRGYDYTIPAIHAQATTIYVLTLDPPALDDAEPNVAYQVGATLTTAVTYGGDGAFRWTGVADGEYYVSCYYDGHRAWKCFGSVIDPIPKALMESFGDTIYRDSDGPNRVGIGLEGDFYKVMSGIPAWSTEVPMAAGLSVFGDGSDGDVVTAGGGAGDVTLSRDMFYNTLTVAAGDTMTTDGYRIFVEGELINNGIIERDGNNATGVGGLVGAALNPGSLGGSSVGGVASGTGGAGGGGAGVLLIAAFTITNNNIISALGGNGFDAGAGAGSAGTTGGAGGAVTAPTAVQGGWRASPFCILLKDETTEFNGSSGGGGGAENGNGNAGGAVAAGIGVAGGKGGDVAAGAGGGGGGGGGGGVLMLVYNTATWTTESVAGGTGGAGVGTGAAGTAGTVGKVIKLPNA